MHSTASRSAAATPCPPARYDALGFFRSAPPTNDCRFPFKLPKARLSPSASCLMMGPHRHRLLQRDSQRGAEVNASRVGGQHAAEFTAFGVGEVRLGLVASSRLVSAHLISTHLSSSCHHLIASSPGHVRARAAGPRRDDESRYGTTIITGRIAVSEVFSNLLLRLISSIY